MELVEASERAMAMAMWISHGGREGAMACLPSPWPLLPPRFRFSPNPIQLHCAQFRADSFNSIPLFCYASSCALTDWIWSKEEDDGEQTFRRLLSSQAMAAMAARADHVAAVVALANSSSPVVASNSHTTSNRVSVRAPSGWRVQRDRERRWAASVKLVMGLTPSSSSRKGNTTVMQAGNNNGQVANEDTDEKILPYCDISKKSKKSLGEMEQEFLEALQSFYFDKQPIMSNEEFDNLKEELTWEGSSVVILSSDEQKFLEASLSYAAGKPILNDQEFDDLKMRLKQKGSKVAIAGPRCSLRSKKVVSDATVDYLKMTLLNAPAALLALGLVFFLDDITGFEITYLLELPEPYSFLVTWFIVLPVTFLITQALTNVVLKDSLILKGPCPNCGAPVTSFFGTILTIPSGGPENNVKCEPCGSSMIFDAKTRLITLDTTKPPEEKKAPRPPGGKKVAKAAKTAATKVSTSA